MTDYIGALHDFWQMIFIDAVSLRHRMAPARMTFAAIVKCCAECGIFGAYKSTCGLE